MVLCTACRAALNNPKLYAGLEALPAEGEVRENVVGHHTSTDALRTAAQSCRICERFCEELDRRGAATQHTASWTAPDAYVTEVTLSQFNSRSTRLMIQNCFGDDESRANIYYWIRGARAFEHMLTSTRVRGPSTGSEDSWQMALRWIKDCTDQHEVCKLARNESWIPLRLLEIASTRDRVRLRGRNDLPKGTGYVTLSYCWGNESFLQLSKRTQPALEGSVPPGTLPPVFQDAITVTSRLGLQYLWIDSLCMFQDDKGSEGWLQEARLMDKVYRYSFCNLAATAAMGPSEGLFRPRGTGSMRDQLIHLPSAEPLTNDGFPDTGHLLMEPDEDSRIHLNGRIFRRAWVVQERFLAPRVLHFARDELMWECKTTWATESWPRGLPRRNRLMWSRAISYMHGYDPRTLKCPLRPHSASSCRAHSLWSRIVMAYSASELSNTEDKLVAVAGMARFFAPIFQSPYFAGLWQRHLRQALLWIVDHEMSRKPRPRVYRAPSWSWAAVDGQVGGLSYDADHGDAEARRDGNDAVTSDGEDDTSDREGDTSDGGDDTSDGEDDESMLFKVIDVRKAPLRDDDEYFALWPGGSIFLRLSLRRLVLDYDGSADDRPALKEVAGSSTDNMFQTCTLSLYWDHTPDIKLAEASEQHRLYCAPVETGILYDDGVPVVFSYSFMIFESIDLHQHFERVGFISICDDYVPEIAIRDPDEATLPCLSYDAGQGLHVIEVC